MDTKQIGQVEETAKELFGLLEIEDPFEIKEIEEGVEISINAEDSGVIIGRHGENLEGLQLVLSLCVSKKLGEFKRISLEVGGYKKKREEWLKDLAIQTKERVLSENREIYLSNLKSWERRIVHMYLAEDDEVSSESQGEGRDRVLIIKPKA